MLRVRVQDLGLVRHRGNRGDAAASHRGSNSGRSALAPGAGPAGLGPVGALNRSGPGAPAQLIPPKRNINGASPAQGRFIGRQLDRSVPAPAPPGGRHDKAPGESGGKVIDIAPWNCAGGAGLAASRLGIRLLVGFLDFSLDAAATVYRIAVVTGPLPDLGGVLVPSR